MASTSGNNANISGAAPATTSTTDTDSRPEETSPTRKRCKIIGSSPTETSFDRFTVLLSAFESAVDGTIGNVNGTNDFLIIGDLLENHKAKCTESKNLFNEMIEELQAAIEEYEKKKGDEVAEEVTSKTVKSHASPKRKSRDPDPLVTINSYEEALNNVKAQVSIKIDHSIYYPYSSGLYKKLNSLVRLCQRKVNNLDKLIKKIDKKIKENAEQQSNLSVP